MAGGPEISTAVRATGRTHVIPGARGLFTAAYAVRPPANARGADRILLPFSADRIRAVCPFVVGAPVRLGAIDIRKVIDMHEVPR